MSNYFTMYKIVAVLAFAYRSSYHCYYLSNYKLGVHMYCLWPPHYYKLGVHVYCLWPPHYHKLGTRRGEESPWTTASHWRQKQFFSFFWLLSYIVGYTSCANRAQLATAWSTGDTCTVCGHPTMSNYFTML